MLRFRVSKGGICFEVVVGWIVFFGNVCLNIIIGIYERDLFGKSYL